MRRKQFEAKVMAPRMMPAPIQHREKAAPTGQQVSLNTMFDKMGVAFPGA